VGIALGSDGARLATSGVRAFFIRRRKLRSSSITASSAAARGIPAAANVPVVPIVVARALSAGARNIPQEVGLPDILHFQKLESPMADKDLNALFLDTLKDIYYAEKQIFKSLPKMAKAANSDQLRAAFEKHHDETEGQIQRLEQIFEQIGKPARGKKCDAIEGILDEGTEIMDEYKGEPALDAGLLAAAQAVEHYEISRYGTLKNWAGKLGMKDAVELLDQTLAEEKKTDDTLTKLADTAVNAEAA
jgi:ferritin-like metal-binding protein YciE